MKYFVVIQTVPSELAAAFYAVAIGSGRFLGRHGDYGNGRWCAWDAVIERSGVQCLVGESG
jgi:hypothetical protein